MKPKWGDVREDGLVFWGLRGKLERWMTVEQFSKAKNNVLSRNKTRKEVSGSKLFDYHKSYREKHESLIKERKRHESRKRGFRRENGLSYDYWIKSLNLPSKTFEAIANLQPDPGQTLTELIHELSGYAMAVCEQIANPPVIEDAPPAQPTPQPDLF
jgi:hypothetical protein